MSQVRQGVGGKRCKDHNIRPTPPFYMIGPLSLLLKIQPYRMSRQGSKGKRTNEGSGIRSHKDSDFRPLFLKHSKQIDRFIGGYAASDAQYQFFPL